MFNALLKTLHILSAYNIHCYLFRQLIMDFGRYLDMDFDDFAQNIQYHCVDNWVNTLLRAK